MAKKSSLYDKADGKIKRIAATIGAITVIWGAFSGLLSWSSMQIQQAISDQIADIRGEVQEFFLKTETQTTRLELLSLMQNQPTNVAGIEKIANHYFHDLGGDWYVTDIYSQWCKEYGGDPSITIGVK